MSKAKKDKTELSFVEAISIVNRLGRDDLVVKFDEGDEEGSSYVYVPYSESHPHFQTSQVLLGGKQECFDDDDEWDDVDDISDEIYYFKEDWSESDNMAFIFMIKPESGAMNFSEAVKHMAENQKSPLISKSNYKKYMCENKQFFVFLNDEWKKTSKIPTGSYFVKLEFVNVTDEILAEMKRVCKNIGLNCKS
jgi:hypothetical protein